jgi:hypothetical protein
LRLATKTGREVHTTKPMTQPANADLFDVEINGILLAYCLHPLMEDEWHIQKKFTSSKNEVLFFIEGCR